MISSYYYKGPPQEPWEFQKTDLGMMNLLVGSSGSGKTRFLNTVFNFADFVVTGGTFRAGTWELAVIAGEYEYSWECMTEEPSEDKYQVKSETIKRRRTASSEEFMTLIERGEQGFFFRGEKLPKLQQDKLSVTLLKEEELIRPLYETFAKVQRRNFHDEGLRDALAFQPVPKKFLEETKQIDGVSRLWKQENTVSAKMFLLKESFPDLFELAVATFKAVFPSITDCEIRMIRSASVNIDVHGPVPAFYVKEKGVSRWIGLHELSSGMQKVLLIVTDIITLPKGSIYMIDEYENSLGVNAIDFLPQFLLDHGEDAQIIITTHHPYLINSMPIKCWRVFKREGSKVSIKKGEEFEEKYGKSKQQAFIQLINDPFYAAG